MSIVEWLVSDTSKTTWDNLIHNIPLAIKTWDPIEDVQFNGVSTDQLRLSAKLN